MGVAEDYALRREEEQRRLQFEVNRRNQVEPDRASRVFRVAAKTNLPKEVVDADLDNLESRVLSDEFNYDDYTDERNGSPIFNKFALEDPYNFAVLERDRKHMTKLERAAHSIDLGWASGWATTEVASIVDRQMKGDTQEGDEARIKELESLMHGGDFGAQSKFLKTLVWTANQLPIQSWIIGQSADEVALFAGAYATGALVAGQVGPQALVLEEALTVPIMAGMGARHGFMVGRTRAAFKLERALAFKEYTDLGLDESEARIAANTVGSVNAVLEGIGVGAMVKRVPGFNKIMKDRAGTVIGNIFKQPTFRQGLARATLMYGEAMATELVTEVLQESMTMAGQEVLKARARERGDDRPELQAMDFDDWAASLKQIAAQTMYGTALIGAVGPLNSLRADAARARQAEENKQVLSAMGEAATDATSREDAPEAWAEFLGRMQKDGPLKEIRVSARGWRQYFQGKDIDPQDAADELGVDVSELDFDQDVVIPFDVFVDKIAPTEHMAGLELDMRFNDDEFTVREAQEFFEKRDQKIAEVEKALQEEFGQTANEEIEADILGQLIASGYNKQASEQQAKLTALVFTNAAAKVGQDPMAFYQSRLGGIRRDIPQSLQKGDFDADVDPIFDALRANAFPKQRDILSGGTLIDMIRDAGGIMDEGGELSARDFGSKFIGVISEQGLSFDGIAELAAERGFIDSYDQDKLVEALEAELDDRPVFSKYASVNEDAQRMLDYMTQAQEFLEREGIDIQVMSNQQIRERLEGIKRYEQMDTDQLMLLRSLVTQAATNDPAMLADIMRQMPRVAEDQDFSSVTITDKFVDKKGKTGTYEVNAQDAYDNAVNERNILNRLLDCVSG